MRLGLLADIHEAVDPLRQALSLFTARGVDRVLVLGDVFDTGSRIEETAAFLIDAGATGVWGNHDFGLCRGSGEWARQLYSPRVLEFARSLLPRLEVEDCLFT